MSTLVRFALPMMLAAAAGLFVWTRIDSPQPAPSPAASPDRARIRYPAGQQPVVALPNGENRKISSLLNIRQKMKFGDYVWNDKGVGGGTVWVRVDLARQTMSVFRAGEEIGSTVILYGTDGKPTPTGVFPILAMAAQHSSNLYDAEMPYMLRLTEDGVAIHASHVQFGAATHGCIGVPIDFARLLFGQVKRGDLVVIVPA
ncbi:L,D-transpeptidase family protein [Sphingomonas sp.]|uniref:L,D-transpeptidase family protein n=1 Tax=Sphingomonas sp. TaxID=28214 RepID=UPI003453A647